MARESAFRVSRDRGIATILVKARLKKRSDGRRRRIRALAYRANLEASFVWRYCDPVDLLIELSVSLVASGRILRAFENRCQPAQFPAILSKRGSGGWERERISPLAVRPPRVLFFPAMSDVGRRGIDRSTRDRAIIPSG